MTNANTTQIIKSTVPSVAALIYRAKVEQGNEMRPQTCAIAALAMYNMLTAIVRDDLVPLDAMRELAKNSIHKANSRNNDMTEFHYLDNEIYLIGLAKRLGFITVDDNKVIRLTDKWVELVSTKDSSVPFTTEVTKEKRRKPFIKGGKVKPSKLMKTAIDYLQATEYHVEHRMVGIVTEVCNFSTLKGGQLPLVIQQELHVWNAACEVVKEEKLYSDYFADNRGRLYHVACAGPNPQSSDFARSLYSHNVENWVNKYEADGVETTAAYKMFEAELADISGGKWMDSTVLTFVANNPERSLFKMLKTGDAPKKPFTYIRLALDWLQFETLGKCDSRVGFGLDAKCSGTQYLAFIAGNKQMAEATGLVDRPVVSKDPYQLSLDELNILLDKSNIKPNAAIMAEYMNPKSGRNFVKTPYMAVQYGGGVGALTGSKDFCDYVLNNLQISKKDLPEFAELCVKAVHNALGDKINLFITRTQEAVKARCEELGKSYFDYKHTDGQLVHKPCFPSIDVCDSFSIRVEGQTRVIFGQQAENKPWTIRAATPTVDEFVRTFVVNYIQGIDALVARTVAKYAKEAGLRGYTSIHDCFRCCLADAPLMMSVIRKAYIEIFVDNNQFEHLSKQLGGINMFHTNIVTKELLNSEHAYYFCQ